QERLGHARGGAPIEEIVEHAPADALAPDAGVDAKVEDVSLTGAHAHDTVADELVAADHHPTDVTDPQAVAENALAPGELVGGALECDHVGDIRLRHRSDHNIWRGLEQLRRGCHRSPRDPSVVGT